MTKIGWARVSTIEQNLDLQIDALKKEGCIKIFEDKISGAKQNIEELSKCIEYMRRGDTLVVWKLSRLHRSMKKGLQLLYELKEKGINIKSLTEGIDTSQKAGEFIYLVLSWLAEWDRENIIENTRAGIEAARARGCFGGRPWKLTQEEVEKLVKMHADHSIPIKDIIKIFGITQQTMNRYVKKHKRGELWFQKNKGE